MHMLRLMCVCVDIHLLGPVWKSILNLKSCEILELTHSVNQPCVRRFLQFKNDKHKTRHQHSSRRVIASWAFWSPFRRNLSYCTSAGHKSGHFTSTLLLETSDKSDSWYTHRIAWFERFNGLSTQTAWIHRWGVVQTKKVHSIMHLRNKICWHTPIHMHGYAGKYAEPEQEMSTVWDAPRRVELSTQSCFHQKVESLVVSQRTRKKGIQWMHLEVDQIIDSFQRPNTSHDMYHQHQPTDQTLFDNAPFIAFYKSFWHTAYRSFGKVRHCRWNQLSHAVAVTIYQCVACSNETQPRMVTRSLRPKDSGKITGRIFRQHSHQDRQDSLETGNHVWQCQQFEIVVPLTCIGL